MNDANQEIEKLLAAIGDVTITGETFRQAVLVMEAFDALLETWDAIQNMPGSLWCHVPSPESNPDWAGLTMTHPALNYAARLAGFITRFGGAMAILGKPNRGKTAFCKAIFDTFDDSPFCSTDVAFLTESKLFEYIHLGYDSLSALPGDLRRDVLDSRNQTVIGYFSGVDFLILDDVGRKTGKEDWRHSVYSDLLEKRADMRRATIITTNLNWAQLGTYIGVRAMARLQRAMELGADEFPPNLMRQSSCVVNFDDVPDFLQYRKENTQ